MKFEIINVECYYCHKNEYINAKNPNHLAAKFPTTCSDCHNILNTTWGGAFKHDFFPLIGGHGTKNCSSCHKNNVFKQIDRSCQSCHLEDYNKTLNPNHKNVGLSIKCEDCHEITFWNQSKFNHSQTRFPLQGGHLSANCESCHSGRTAGTSTICFDCHQLNYNRTSNPNHIRLGISTDCSSCHTTNPGWKPAEFPIHNNFYLLTGKHLLIKNNCFDCHKGNYSNTPNLCMGCHLNSFNQAINPNHLQLQFPSQCELCHNTNGWRPSTFNHDQMYFPIFSGKHRNTWNDCRICHNNVSNYSIFSCLNCHEHRKDRMDDKHKNVNGYLYDSNACLSCHPNGTSFLPIDNLKRIDYK